ncbi:pyridoxal phosphate-dependent aminotransferase [Lentilactobacillus sp. SPB1-3]|uniref:Pyridoxal phosphate-dependent aminotransferase n=1 Tax=Lentilactobacillus terminaliae TaxID=3003483 RepID=A0ACD5DCH4_9LACO|nr:pyridoxal phosphate-dependent aminotransferase [Lentilactobacillus sp. SPB1-3]MCZ0977223.1 pyridoxal phosphate-dependent aminotransferase [Lentilactobacillus sp. SPB1-3]
MKFSKRSLAVKPSATVKVSNKAKQMIADGIDVINLGIGEPDFQTPDSIDQAAIEAINSGKASFYTPASGLSALKDAISQRIKADFDVFYSPDNISVTNGAKMALYTLMQVLVDEGDEVLIPKPGWVSYEQQIVLAGANPVMVSTNDEFKITEETLNEAVTKNTRLLIINSPQNPTGTIYTKEELTAIGNWAIMHNIMIIADDIYGSLVYNGAEFTSLIQLDDNIVAQTILVNGLSKSYSMTGWRIGYIAAAPEIISKVNAILSHSTSNPAAVSQYASIAALTGDQSVVEQMRLAFEDRLNKIYPLLQDVPGFNMAVKPQGAFYMFPNVEEAVRIAGLSSSSELVEKLLDEAHVATVDGAAFGLPGYLRLSYAASLDNLIEAVSRINEYMQSFTK